MSEKTPLERGDKAHKDAAHFIPELDRSPDIRDTCSELVRDGFQKVQNFDLLSNAHTELPLELRIHVNESWETLTCIIYRLKRKGDDHEHERDVPIYIYQSNGAGGNDSKPALSDALMKALVEDILEEWRLLESDTVDGIVLEFDTLLRSTIECHQRDGRISKASHVQSIYTMA